MRFNYKFENKKGMKPYKYDNGKIYKIVSPQAEKYYIGSTIQTLKKRLIAHKSKYKLGLLKSTSRHIIKYNDCYIELLEDYKCNNKHELLKKESEWINEHKDNIINYRIEGRHRKQYLIDKKEIISKYTKQYYIDNKDTITKYRKQYIIDNKDKLLKNKKQYYIDNKDTITKKYMCDCGKIYTHSHFLRHTKTKRHITYINNPFHFLNYN